MSRLKPVVFQSPPKIGIADALQQLIDTAGARLIRQVLLLDEMLVDIDQLLNILQPARSGKVRIEWVWVNDIKKPRAVVYSRRGLQKRGKWTREVAGVSNLPRRAKRTGLFHENHQVVRQLLVHAQTLMSERANLVLSVTNLSQSSSRKLESVEPKANRLREEIWETFRNLDTHVRFDKRDPEAGGDDPDDES